MSDSSQLRLVLSLVSSGRGGGGLNKKFSFEVSPPSDLRVTQFACLDSGQGERAGRNVPEI